MSAGAQTGVQAKKARPQACLSACRKTSPQGSLARVPPRARGGIKLEFVISEDLKLPPRGIAAAAYAKNVPPAHFLHAAASEMTLLMTDGVTIS